MVQVDMKTINDDTSFNNLNKRNRRTLKNAAVKVDHIGNFKVCSSNFCCPKLWL